MEDTNDLSTLCRDDSTSSNDWDIHYLMVVYTLYIHMSTSPVDNVDIFTHYATICTTVNQ